MPKPPLNYSFLDPWLTPSMGVARWCVAFSGGPDSSVLLHLLHSWCANSPGEAPALVAIHVNHAMQSSADSWQAHCEGVCERLGIKLIVHQALVESSGQGLEAAARQARYELFEAELTGGDLLFLGHHLDDQVETYFLRLLRGSGLSGLSAMPARRVLGEGELLRPLLAVERSVLEAYVDNHGLSVIQDPSNMDTTLDRNYLRQQVLPVLAHRWPGYRQTVVRAADQASISQAVLDECLPVPHTVFSVMGDPGVELRELDSVSFEAALIKLRRWLRYGGYPMPDRQVLVEFMRQLREGAAASSPRLECSSYVLQRYQHRVYLLPGFLDDLTDSPVALLPGGESQVAGAGSFHLQPAEGGGVRLTQSDSLELRWRQGGERCRPEGRPYNQRLKKLFQEFEVPPWWRERVPLLYLGDELLAVGGLFQCESSRLQPDSALGEDLWQLRWTRKPCAFD